MVSNKRIMQVLQREFTSGTVYRVDFDRVDVAPDGSPGILRSLSIVGDRDKIKEGDPVRIVSVAGERMVLVRDVAVSEATTVLTADATDALATEERNTYGKFGDGGILDASFFEYFARSDHDHELPGLKPVNQMNVTDPAGFLTITPVGGRCVVGSGAVGAFAGYDNHIFTYSGSTPASSDFDLPRLGDTVYDFGTDKFYIFDVRSGPMPGWYDAHPYISASGISSPQNGQALVYDSATGKWVNRAITVTNADTLDGQHASAFAQAIHYHNGVVGYTGNAPIGVAHAIGSEVQGTGGAASLAFHRPNAYAVNFGLDSDNKLKVGGWSMGNAAYEIWHAGNQAVWTNFTPTWVGLTGTLNLGNGAVWAKIGRLTIARGYIGSTTGISGTFPNCYISNMPVTAEFGGMLMLIDSTNQNWVGYGFWNSLNPRGHVPSFSVSNRYMNWLAIAVSP